MTLGFLDTLALVESSFKTPFVLIAFWLAACVLVTPAAPVVEKILAAAASAVSVVDVCPTSRGHPYKARKFCDMINHRFTPLGGFLTMASQLGTRTNVS